MEEILCKIVNTQNFMVSFGCSSGAERDPGWRGKERERKQRREVARGRSGADGATHGQNHQNLKIFFKSPLSSHY